MTCERCGKEAEVSHVPVLCLEVVEYLAPRPGGLYVDGTVGLGGHARAILEASSPDGFLLGIDRDREAVEIARRRLEEAGYAGRFRLVHDSYHDLPAVLARSEIPEGEVDGILLDLGVSSLQLDEPGRGFSYQEEGPLDMRMDRDGQTLTAREILNTWPEREIARILKEFGEERWAERVAQFIVTSRQRRPLAVTSDLVTVIKDAIPAGARRRGGHPARRTFQALRIAVNQELDFLAGALRAAVGALRRGGRIAVISFHSLEDRTTKQTFADLARGCTCPPELPVCGCGKSPLLKLLTRRPVSPGPGEEEANPRSRSARLRVAERVGSF
ncbi:MAG: 16S rRNA (cytosine(1402)-N(4))-methyltransferase RsmH [Firmicutes bacterium]|nr:16S rRNA (cytosine(1402)-N(4))-methyltransferase RsmH [Bacillota bacterium]